MALIKNAVARIYSLMSIDLLVFRFDYILFALLDASNSESFGLIGVCAFVLFKTLVLF